MVRIGSGSYGHSLRIIDIWDARRVLGLGVYFREQQRSHFTLVVVQEWLFSPRVTTLPTKRSPFCGPFPELIHGQCQHADRRHHMDGTWCRISNTGLAARWCSTLPLGAILAWQYQTNYYPPSGISLREVLYRWMLSSASDWPIQFLQTLLRRLWLLLRSSVDRPIRRDCQGMEGMGFQCIQHTSALARNELRYGERVLGIASPAQHAYRWGLDHALVPRHLLEHG